MRIGACLGLAGAAMLGLVAPAVAAEAARVAAIPADAKLIFASDRAQEKGAFGAVSNELYVATLDGEVTRITYSRQLHDHFVVSPDRTRIATDRYSRGDTNKDGRIFSNDHKVLWILDTVAGSEREVDPDTDAGNGGIAWFPDGRHVVFGTQSDLFMDLVKVDIDTGETAALTRGLKKLLGHEGPRKFVSDVDVSPDGQWLAFVYVDVDAIEPGESGKPRIAVMKVDGSAAHLVTDGGPAPSRRRGDWPNGDFDPDFSPDGTRLSFQRQTETAMVYPTLSSMDIMTVSVDGTGLRRLSPEGNANCHGISSWTADGIVFTEWSKTGVSSLVADPDTGAIVRVPIEGNASFVQWIPPGR
ncbi:MAG: PD40 domain-containing protein [Alphaproteobacteria bacterium]|nr:PD40 domain-containing protein [Alphaproteobacteria bacterium]